jgi:hypothetical protein
MFFFVLMIQTESPAVGGAKRNPEEAEVSEPDLEAEVDEGIRICGGDVRAALRATLVANSYLEVELERLTKAISTGFARGRIRKAPRQAKN